MVQNMNKKLKIQIRLMGFLFGILFLVFAVSFTSFSADTLWDEYKMPNERLKERLLDNVSLMTIDEQHSLLNELDTLSNKWNCNIVVLTVASHDGEIQSYADDYFDYNGFGADFEGSGILFMLSMENREYAVSTRGIAISAFTDYGIQYITNEMYPYLRDGNYYDAFRTYAAICDKFLEMYAEGTPYDVNNNRIAKNSSDYLRQLIISILGGLVIAIFPILWMKSQLRTVKMSSNASNYQSSQGIKVNVQRDRFIRKALTKTPIPKDTNRGGSGGGSSIHTSSSGSSHGGSHGHF